MIALYIILALLIIIAVILLLRAGVLLVYSEEGFTADVKIGAYRFRAFPQEEKPKEKKVRKYDKKAPPEEKPEKEKGGSLKTFQSYWSAATETLGRLRRRMTVNELTLHVAAGGSDPANVALAYGGVNAAMGMIIPVLEQSLDIKKRDFETSFSFELKEPYIFARLKATAAVWELIYVGWPLFSKYMKTRNTKDGKEEK